MTEQQVRTHAIDVSSVLRDQKRTDEPNETCIKVENLNLFYAEKQALHGVNMEMPKKKVTAYIGPSGCGKSTLLNLIAGLDKPDSGIISIGGVEITSLSEGELARWRAASVGFIFQFYNLIPVDTIKELVGDDPLYKIEGFERTSNYERLQG